MIEQKPYCWRVPRPPGHLKIGLIPKNAAISYPNKEIIDATTDHNQYGLLSNYTRGFSSTF